VEGHSAALQDIGEIKHMYGTCHAARKFIAETYATTDSQTTSFRFSTLVLGLKNVLYVIEKASQKTLLVNARQVSYIKGATSTKVLVDKIIYYLPKPALHYQNGKLQF
jgi:hypothetical protein